MADSHTTPTTLGAVPAERRHPATCLHTWKLQNDRSEKCSTCGAWCLRDRWDGLIGQYASSGAALPATAPKEKD